MGAAVAYLHPSYGPEEWSPPCLEHVEPKPVFQLAPGVPNSKRQYRRALRTAGLRFHASEQIRAEVMLALRQLWSPEEFAASEKRLQAFWATMDACGEPDPAEAAAIDDLLDRLERHWPRLARMAADNAEFAEDALPIAASLFIVGWSGVDVAFQRFAGEVPLHVIDELRDALGRIEDQAITGGVADIEKGLAFAQLINAASARITAGAAEVVQ
jgi:hypothetical protein